MEISGKKKRKKGRENARKERRKKIKRERERERDDDEEKRENEMQRLLHRGGWAQLKKSCLVFFCKHGLQRHVDCF